jgi:hypothetical protein
MDVATAPSLDPLELPVTEKALDASSCQDAPLPNLPQPFKHTGWRPQRERIYRALQAADVGRWRARRFATCGAQAWILAHREDPERYKIVLTCCHDRFCVPCARARAFNIRANLAKHTEGLTLRFVTLTMAHSDHTLDHQLDRLYRAFRSLRATPLWRDRVRGGVAFLEVKLSEVDNRWHPHFHCLIDSTFLPQQLLSSTWLDVTSDSKIVDIRLVRDPAEVDKYITKYVTKPASANTFRDPLRLDELVKALAHRRLFITFGECRRWRLTAPADPTDWTLLYHEAELREKAHEGDELAQAMMDRIIAFLFGQEEPEFSLPRRDFGRGPPSATPDAQLTLW